MNLGFVSTRFAGTDGVSLEAAKWAEVFQAQGHNCFWFAGLLSEDRVGHLVPEAYFNHDKNKYIQSSLFEKDIDTSQIDELIEELTEHIKLQLYYFCNKYKIDVLVAQNSFCLPMPITLGFGLSRFVIETQTPTIAHHHDFYWERKRYGRHRLGNKIKNNFPPSVSCIEHIAINSEAVEQLRLRKGLTSTVVPNVFNFENPPRPLDDYGKQFRQDAGVRDDEKLVLQPTRVVRRKGIEHAVTLLSKLREFNPHLVISHAAGDEGLEYKEELIELARQLNVKMSFVDELVGPVRTVEESGRRIYTLEDAYQAADFVTYPSLYEGFGNAFLEGIYFKKPMLVNRYPVFIQDIEPKKFDLVLMDGEVTNSVVGAVSDLFENSERAKKMVDHNYELGRKFYGYVVLSRLLESCLGRVTQKKEITASSKGKLLSQLNKLYPSETSQTVLGEIEGVLSKYELPSGDSSEPWSEKDVVLIAYGDHVGCDSSPTLGVLKKALDRFKVAFSCVHLLPFYPYSSDEGFSVIDYKTVNAEMGDWEDVRAIGQDYNLMFDFPLNHISQESAWFKGYLRGEQKYKDYFVEVDPGTDLSKVVRPRNLPLTHEFNTNSGTKHIWTTFSRDQVDLNIKNPTVLVELIDIFLFYLSRGARIVRLDAIAFLWKEIGTNCLHLPQTHAFVKLLRVLVDEFAPQTILLTETNVPHAENVSYFGASDEAHMVYQFSLPPLLLEALLTGETKDIRDWAKRLEYMPGTTYFNFTASHDGIGVRPLQGLISNERFDKLIAAVIKRGAQISYKKNSDGSESPYELNITYYSALSDSDSSIHRDRFLASQAICLSLKGVPAIYFSSLFGITNNVEGFHKTKQNRTLNRERFSLQALESRDNGVLEPMRKLIALRSGQKAFHPDGSQHVFDLGPGLFGFRREHGGQCVDVIANFTAKKHVNPKPEKTDLITLKKAPELSPYQVVWLK